jgi:hypothetical protein
MPYCIRIRPRDKEPLTLAEFRQRFIACGLEPHPDAQNPDEDISGYYQNTVMYEGGMIRILHDFPGWDKATAQASISWSFPPAVVSALLARLREIADAVNADLIGSNDEPLGPDAAQVLASHYDLYKRTVSAILGGDRPVRSPTEPSPAG